MKALAGMSSTGAARGMALVIRRMSSGRRTAKCRRRSSRQGDVPRALRAERPTRLAQPSTPREDELMGKTRDSLIDGIKDLGQEAVEKGKQMASAAAENLKQHADTQGLSADAVAEKLRAAGRDVVETVKTEAQKQNLLPQTAPEQEREAAHQTPQP